jgi:hydroxyacylglutathione hydrolase
MSRSLQFHFFQRPYPSANMVLVAGLKPILIDTGFGSDVAETERLVRRVDQSPQRLSLIVNTHYHSDHVGGNHVLQQRYGLSIAAHMWEAAMVNTHDVEACSAVWLDQPVEAYHVDRELIEGDEIDVGGAVLQVVHTPGHTLGHIALYEPREQVLICGDAVHANDVSWINPFREGAGALQRTMSTLDRIARLPLQRMYSGHGPAVETPLASIDAARRRYEQWLLYPEKVGWHACKRIFAFALMIGGGLAEEAVPATLLASPWFQDYSRFIFNQPPADFIEPFIAEMLRSGAAAWRQGRLVALTAYVSPIEGWLKSPARPAQWI